MRLSPWRITLVIYVGSIVVSASVHHETSGFRSSRTLPVVNKSQFPTTATCIRGGDDNQKKDNIFQLASPYWSSFSKLVQDKVDPVIKDPKNSANNFWQSLEKFAHSRTEAAKERHEYIEEKPKEAVLGLLGIGRVLRLSLLAWICAEVLFLGGCFHNPSGVGPKLVEVWKEHAEGPVSHLRFRLQEWWSRERFEVGGLLCRDTYTNLSILGDRIRALPLRYQFAMGASAGMIVSPLLWSVATKFCKLAVMTYGFAELNEYWRDTSLKSETLIELCGIQGKAGDSINDFLENYRDTIRETVLHPQELWMETRYSYSVKDFMPQATIPIQVKQGFLLGSLVGIIIV